MRGLRVLSGCFDGRPGALLPMLSQRSGARPASQCQPRQERHRCDQERQHAVRNGTAQAKPSPLKASLAPGTYEITLQLAGYKPLRKSVVVEKDKPLEINETLEKQ